MSAKVIVTNTAALKNKYGTTGLSAIQKALTYLVKRDLARGLATRVVALNDAVQMKGLKAPAVTKSSDPKQNKTAVDAVCATLKPDYLVLLGGPDVVPHQDLKNPIYKAGVDDDQVAWSDLPYACVASYSKNVQDFLGPVRVVGRIPDAPKATSTTLLVTLLRYAAEWAERPQSEYTKYLGISADVWKGSTALSLKNLFGNSTSLKLAPPNGPKWTNLQLAPRMHFINCHGAPSDSQFYGQKGSSYPVSHDASWLKGKTSAGTVIAAECCYGAEIYDPADTNGQPGICLQYLSDGAHGFLGSTTIAYGPASGNGSADLICQYFLAQVLAGASLGRATLEARHKFVQNATMTDPADLKTIAQFVLLGDPSVQPVAKSKPHLVPLSNIAKALGTKLDSKAMMAAAAAARQDRRRALYTVGSQLMATQPFAAITAPGAMTAVTRRALNKLAAEVGMQQFDILSFTVKTPSAAARAGAKAIKGLESAAAMFHVATSPATKGPGKGRYGSLLIAREVGGSIVSVRHLHGKGPA